MPRGRGQSGFCHLLCGYVRPGGTFGPGGLRHPERGTLVLEHRRGRRDYYHVDPAASLLGGDFRELRDEEMEGYVWDYSEYPACVGHEAPPEPAAETETTAPVGITKNNLRNFEISY